MYFGNPDPFILHDPSFQSRYLILYGLVKPGGNIVIDLAFFFLSKYFCTVQATIKSQQADCFLLEFVEWGRQKSNEIVAGTAVAVT